MERPSEHTDGRGGRRGWQSEKLEGELPPSEGAAPVEMDARLSEIPTDIVKKVRQEVKTDVPGLEEAGNFGLENVHGDNDMQLVTETVYPWPSVAYITVERSGGGAVRGTAFYVAPRLLVTAAHCLEDEAGKATKVNVFPGLRADGSTVLPSSSAMAYRTPQGWFNNWGAHLDYGLILVPPAAAHPGAHFTLTVLADQQLWGLPTILGGYPSINNSKRLMAAGGRLGPPTATVLPHVIDSENGQSGGPTFTLSGGVAHAVGIHTTGTVEFNWALRITPTVLAEIKGWATAWGLPF